MIHGPWRDPFDSSYGSDTLFFIQHNYPYKTTNKLFQYFIILDATINKADCRILRIKWRRRKIMTDVKRLRLLIALVTVLNLM